MTESFKVLGCNHHTAPLAVREKLALRETAIRNLLLQLKELPDLSDALVISTCNRTEIYYAAPQDHSEAIIALLADACGQKAADIAPHLRHTTDSAETAKHLFDVALGLDASVVGDMQVIGQVKQAYQMCADTGLAGPYLHRLLHTIFFANKKVVQETRFREGAASVSYAAMELVQELTGERTDTRVLVLGLGEIGADTARNLHSNGFRNLQICNRTEEKAAALQAELGEGATHIAFAEVWNAIAWADVVISSVAADTAFINADKLAPAMQGLSYKYLIDLSVPRSIDPAVENLNGALVYNIDSINVRVSQALEVRMAAIPHVEAIRDTALEEFGDWSREMIVSPTIQKLKSALEQIRLEEMSRFTRKMNDDESRLADQITKSIMQKVLKLPVLQLKAACRRGDADTLIDVLNDLFNLEAQPEPEGYTGH
ncbi:MAG: glutamyl-tRNA reductase [Bacteroidota bacterium]